MAANTYYSSFDPAKRADAPPSPAPVSSSPSPMPAPYPHRPHIDTESPLSPSGSYHPTRYSPASSPFADKVHPAYVPDGHMPHNPYGPTSIDDTAYHGPNAYGQGSRPDNDPFGDHQEIPLRSQQSRMEKRPSQYDPEGRAPLVGAPDSLNRDGGSRRNNRIARWLSGRTPWVIYILTIIQIAVFIGEVIRNAVLTGSPIMIKPQFNPMIGPSGYVYINMGARYVPCMRQMGGNGNEIDITPDVLFPCPNSTTGAAECSLNELCGMSGIPQSSGELHPNQWYRFITPIFLHGGLIHIGFNLFVQVTVGGDMERLIGPVRLFLVYFAAGIFGNVLGANYAPNGQPSVGASGAIFGIIALTLLDLLYHWKERPNPKRQLLFILVDVVIAFVLGLLPGLDNFAHIGGFIMGIALGISILHSPQTLRERIGTDETPYSAVPSSKYADFEAMKNFGKQPVGFFKGRKPLWWAWWLIRAGFIVTVIVVFIVLLNNFYVSHSTCNWCKYLSCIPVSNWCDTGYLELTNSTSKRDLFGLERFTLPGF